MSDLRAVRDAILGASCRFGLVAGALAGTVFGALIFVCRFHIGTPLGMLMGGLLGTCLGGAGGLIFGFVGGLARRPSIWVLAGFVGGAAPGGLLLLLGSDEWASWEEWIIWSVTPGLIGAGIGCAIASGVYRGGSAVPVIQEVVALVEQEADQRAAVRASGPMEVAPSNPPEATGHEPTPADDR